MNPLMVELHGLGIQCGGLNMLLGEMIKRMANKVIVFDSFNRANNANSLGNADTGQAWQPLQGTWGIDNNAAYTTNTSGFARAVIDSGLSNCIVSCTLSTLSADGTTRFIFRQLGINNELYIGVVATGYEIDKRVTGSPTLLGSYSITPKSGDRLQVTLNGSNIKVYLNDILIFNVTETFNQNQTKHGLCVYNSSAARYDNFKVEAI
jgi:hypothetical protein